MRGEPQTQDDPETKEHTILCYIDLKQAATCPGHHFLRFQKRLNGSYAANISDFRAGDHGHFDG